jgi:ferrous iron transport protein B
MDGIMRKFGLQGRSFVPLILGFGCSVPAIMATRTIESEKDRNTTIMVLPLFSCGARLPIYALIIPAFFAEI